MLVDNVGTTIIFLQIVSAGSEANLLQLKQCLF